MEELELISVYLILVRTIVVYVHQERPFDEIFQKLEELRAMRERCEHLRDSNPSALYLLLFRVVVHKENELLPEVVSCYDNAISSHLGYTYSGSLSDELALK